MPQTTPCPQCRSPNTVRNGRHTATRTQKAVCRDCGTHFRTRYRNHAWRPGTDRRIDQLADAGHSIRQIARKLGLSPTTVQSRRKTLADAYREQIARPYSIPSDVLHVVSWSGGKDSSALVVWALEHLPQADTRYVFCDTGWESPLTYRFIEEINHRLLGGRLIVLRSRRYADLLDLARQRGRFPSTKARFCTEELKIVPMIEWILSQTRSVAVYQGIRAGESLARSRMASSGEFFEPQLLYDRDPYTFIDGKRQKRRKPRFQNEVTKWLESYECSVERPFFHWKTADILTLCRRHGVLNPLYDLGFHRVGCFPCIMARKQDIRLIAEHDPGRIDTIAQAERETRSSFFRYSTVPAHFAAEPTIRDIVAWATTPGRGKPDIPDRPCMSHFMRCE